MGLDGYEFLLWTEKNFGIEIPNQDATRILAVGELAKYISERLVQIEGFKAPSSRTVFAVLKEELVRQFRLQPDKITPESQFVRDLGIN